MILYSVPHSLYCAKTRILLRAKGIAWQEHSPAEDRAGFSAASPFGNLPALQHGDFTLSDSEAIAEYLEEAFPEPPMLPQSLPLRARMRERGRFHDTRLEPAVRLLFPLVARPDAATATRAQEAVSVRLVHLARLLAWPLPFGLGDCGYAPTFLWIDLLAEDLGLSITWPDAVRTWRAELAAIPAVAEELRAYQPQAMAWMDEKRALRISENSAAGGLNP